MILILAFLTLIGAVRFRRKLTTAAAGQVDGGRAVS